MNGFLTVTQMADELGVNRSQCYRALRELEDNGSLVRGQDFMRMPTGRHPYGIKDTDEVRTILSDKVEERAQRQGIAGEAKTR